MSTLLAAADAAVESTYSPSSVQPNPIELPASESSLIEAAQRREPRAFEALMRRHNRRLYRVARSILRDPDAAEDAVQEAYIRAFTRLSQYAPTGSFAAWLTRLTINEALMLKRKERRSSALIDDALADAPDEDAGTWVDQHAAQGADEVERSGLRQLLEEAFDRLPEEFRTVFVLRAVEQLSTAETADCLGVNAATVKTRLHRARAKLRAELTRRFRREQLHLFEFAGERCDRIVACVLTRLCGAPAKPAMLASAVAAFTLAIACALPYSPARANDDREDRAAHVDFATEIHAIKEIRKGREFFRRATFGDEAFWGGELRLHEAIAGAANGGVGPGLSPKAALSLGLKVDVGALPKATRRALAAGQVDLNNPAVTLQLLRLDAVVGVTGFFDGPRLKAVGIQCSLCHSVVDNSFAPGIGRPLDGWANRDLNIGAIIALAPRLDAFSQLLGVDVATVRTVLNSWGPGKFDAELILDGKAFRPDGKPAATLIPPAFGLAGVNLHTWTGWGSVPHWNAFVANLDMRGQGTFYDPRLDDADRFPIAAREGFGHVVSEEDQITPALPSLHLYQLSLKAPSAPRGSYDRNAAKRGQQLFNTKARCSSCHVPPLYTEPGWNMHTAEEIGIDDFQAQRSPDGRYRTAPLRGLWTHTKGGFYHDGRFATLRDVIAHYDSFMSLGLSSSERADLEQFLRSL